MTDHEAATGLRERARRSSVPLAGALCGVTLLVLAGIVGLETELGAPPQPTRVVVVAKPVATPAHPPFQPLAEQPVLTPPTFEVAGIGSEHQVVATGSAAPGAMVSILDGAREVGRVRASASGRWAFSGTMPLSPGGHELDLAERAADAPTDRPPTLGAEPMMLVVDDAASAPAVGSSPPDALPQVRLAPGAIAAVARPAPAGTAPHIITASYDTLGTPRLSGRAADGAPLVVLLDGRRAGRASADGRGRWAVALAGRVKAGRHRLQVEQVTTGGRVLVAANSPLVRD